MRKTGVAEFFAGIKMRFAHRKNIYGKDEKTFSFLP